jgi:hypothetical protein
MTMKTPVLAVVAALALAGSARAKKPPRYEESADGELVTVKNGKLAWLGSATVRLVCVTTSTPSDDNRNRDACSSSLRVEKDGKTIARLDRDVFGIDFERVAGNADDLSLALFPLESGALIAVRDGTREGDMWWKEKVIEQLFIVDGKTLREVYRWTPLEAYEPGPDGKDEDRKHDVAELTTVPRDVLVLREGDHETRLAWNGEKFAEPDVTPLVRRVLEGKRLAAAELAALSDDDLQRLRNAPYARHGRPFKNAALQQYFYGILKLTPNPSFSESQLDRDDKLNLALVLDETRARKK